MSLVRLLVIAALLAVPLVVVMTVPRFFELVAAVPAVLGSDAGPTPTPGFHLGDPTPTPIKSRFAPIDETPPPTLAPPPPPQGPAPTLVPSPTGERVVIGNTGGRGAVLRADPVSGRVVAALHDQQVLDVIERRAVAGSGDWVHVRTTDGVEGWVTGVVALPLTSPATR